MRVTESLHPGGPESAVFEEKQKGIGPKVPIFNHQEDCIIPKAASVGNWKPSHGWRIPTGGRSVHPCALWVTHVLEHALQLGLNSLRMGRIHVFDQREERGGGHHRDFTSSGDFADHNVAGKQHRDVGFLG